MNQIKQVCVSLAVQTVALALTKWGTKNREVTERHLRGIIEVKQTRLGMVVYTHNSSTKEVEISWALWVQGHPGLHIKFQTSQGYVEGSASKNKQTNNKKDIANEVDKEEAKMANIVQF